MGVDAVMIVRVKRPIRDDEINQLAYDLVEAFGTDPFFITNEYPNRVYRALKRAEADDTDLTAEDGETLLEVGLGGRYYGVGYERGDLPTLLAIAAWLERRVEGGEVWYGGDSGEPSPFPRDIRRRLFDHFAEHGHKPYRGVFDHPGVGEIHPLENPVCTFCGHRTHRVGWGGSGGFGAFICHGCGWHVETRDHGVTWKVLNEVGGMEVRETIAK